MKIQCIGAIEKKITSVAVMDLSFEWLFQIQDELPKI